MFVWTLITLCHQNVTFECFHLEKNHALCKIDDVRRGKNWWQTGKHFSHIENYAIRITYRVCERMQTVKSNNHRGAFQLYASVRSHSRTSSHCHSKNSLVPVLLTAPITNDQNRFAMCKFVQQMNKHVWHKHIYMNFASKMKRAIIIFIYVRYLHTFSTLLNAFHEREKKPLISHFHSICNWIGNRRPVLVSFFRNCNWRLFGKCYLHQVPHFASLSVPRSLSLSFALLLQRESFAKCKNWQTYLPSITSFYWINRFQFNSICTWLLHKL